MSTEQARLQDHVDSIAQNLNTPWEDWDQDLAEDPDQGFTASGLCSLMRSTNARSPSTVMKIGRASCRERV